VPLPPLRLVLIAIPFLSDRYSPVTPYCPLCVRVNAPTTQSCPFPLGSCPHESRGPPLHEGMTGVILPFVKMNDASFGPIGKVSPLLILAFSLDPAGFSPFLQRLNDVLPYPSVFRHDP